MAVYTGVGAIYYFPIWSLKSCVVVPNCTRTHVRAMVGCLHEQSRGRPTGVHLYMPVRTGTSTCFYRLLLVTITSFVNGGYALHRAPPRLRFRVKLHMRYPSCLVFVLYRCSHCTHHALASIFFPLLFFPFFMNSIDHSTDIRVADTPGRLNSLLRSTHSGLLIVDCSVRLHCF